MTLFLLLHYFQAPQITARDILEYAESEFRDYGQHMVEYVGLNAFVRNPVFHGGEEIKFVNSICFLSDERLTSVLYGLPSISQSLFSAKSGCCSKIQQKARIVFFMYNYYFLLMSYRRTKKALPYGG